MEAVTRRQNSATRRRDLHEQRIADAQGPIARLGKAWAWVLSEARHLAKPRRWHQDDAVAALDTAVTDLVELARRMNTAGGGR